MKTTDSFKLNKPAKRILATLTGEQRRVFKKLAIEAQVAEEEAKKKPLKREKDSEE